LSEIGTAVLKLQQKTDLHKKQDGRQFLFSFCCFIINWCTKFEQVRYSRSKATADIRFAQKSRWPPKIIFFHWSFYNELVYQFEQDRYSRSKDTAEIRFEQKQDGRQKMFFFVLSFYSELIYQIGTAVLKLQQK